MHQSMWVNPQTSTGLNEAAIALAKELGLEKSVVTVCVDTGLKYMNSTIFGRRMREDVTKSWGLRDHDA